GRHPATDPVRVSSLGQELASGQHERLPLRCSLHIVELRRHGQKLARQSVLPASGYRRLWTTPEHAARWTTPEHAARWRTRRQTPRRRHTTAAHPVAIGPPGIGDTSYGYS